MVVSVNYQRLYEFERNFEYNFNLAGSGVDLTQRKRFDQTGHIGALGLAYAIEISPQLSLGATLNIWTDDLFWDNEWEEVFTERGVGTQGGAPVTIDTRYTDTYTDFSGINANFGLLWNMTPHLTLGAVVKTPFDADIRHDYRFSQTSVFGPPVNSTVTSQQSTSEDVELSMPLSYGVGLAWRVSDALTFDLDIYRTHWSDYILTDSQGNNFSPIDGRLESLSDVEDTIQVRLGGEYLFIPQQRNIVVPVRAGVFYDPEPSHGTLRDFFGITVGSGVAYKRFIFDLAYQLRWAKDVDTGNLIATSEADVTQHLLMASIILHF
jgi:long-subunit fatty acid transport protein